MNHINFYLLKSLDKFIPNTIIVLFGLIPFFVPSPFQLYIPDLGLCALYFWGVYAPEKIFLSFVLLIGLLQDTYLGLPVGTFGFGGVLFFISSLSYHGFLVKKPFLLSWLVFIFMVVVTSLLKMGVNVFILFRPLSMEKFVYEAILTIFSYPPIASLCFNLHQKFS